MNTIFKIFISILFIPSFAVSQNTQIFKGKSEIKRVQYKNINVVKIKKINSDLQINKIIYQDLNNNNILDFGEDSNIKCFITNNSADTLKNFKLNIELNSELSGIIFPTSNIIEILNPKTELELSIPIKNKLQEESTDSSFTLSFKVLSDNVLYSEEEIEIKFKNSGYPVLDIINDYEIKKDTIINNRNAYIVGLTLTIINSGDASLFNCEGKFVLQYLGGFLLSDHHEKYSFEYINPDDKKHIKTNIIIFADIKNNKYPVTFDFVGNNNEFKYSTNIDIEL